ncbi:hypothetical protein SBA2_590022 [Acidobacteriia bacterium SbA2]|nr:hypothetical protein SBA2_590022 [Acidobacteriia bacterium SbA2]
MACAGGGSAPQSTSGGEELPQYISLPEQRVPPYAPTQGVVFPYGIAGQARARSVRVVFSVGCFVAAERGLARHKASTRRTAFLIRHLQSALPEQTTFQPGESEALLGCMVIPHGGGVKVLGKRCPRQAARLESERMCGGCWHSIKCPHQISCRSPFGFLAIRNRGRWAVFTNFRSNGFLGGNALDRGVAVAPPSPRLDGQ